MLRSLFSNFVSQIFLESSEMQFLRKKALIFKKKTKLLYLVGIFMPSFLLLSNGAAADFLNIRMSQNGTRVAVVTSTNIYVYNAQIGEVISQFTQTETGERDKGLPTAVPQALTFSTDAPNYRQCPWKSHLRLGDRNRFLNRHA